MLEGWRFAHARTGPAVFREVVLYVLDKVGDLPETGETVLHKLLYFIDFDFYEKYEESLMGRDVHQESFWADLIKP